VGAGAEIAHDEHVLPVPQANHIGQEVELQSGLRPDGPALVPGISVARHRKGLNDVRAQRRVPDDVLPGIGIRPVARRGEGVDPL
jgi:hypothetical protein